MLCVNEGDEMLRAAQLYYLQDRTMDAVAADLGVSRSTVSRLLARARETGLVRITVAAPEHPADHTARALHEAFGVTVHVVPTPAAAGDPQRIEAVARRAAGLLGDWFRDGMTLGVAWGTTMSAVAAHLRPTELVDARVVQLNGAANARTAGVRHTTQLLDRFATAFGADLYYFPAPAFFDYAETRDLLWQESAVRRILELRRTCDLAVFSVGAFRGRLLSQVYSSGYLRAEEVAALAEQRVVGDVATHFLRVDGSFADIALNRRASGPSPAELRRVTRRLCVVAGDNKIQGTLGALRAGVITDLVVDERTAAGIVGYLRAG
ncbi:sugar-binding transcriptional regulator [Arsenicicoccus dermatophilus]|uniref:sugar-binding transcriptional regulator n=1 Tax=Arsenicicoccus dermatophilus TaxID=1076331 RepID=UPI00391728B3